MKNVDITQCEKEQIHIPKLIQPHGYCISYDINSNKITGFSKNCEDQPILNGEIEDYLGSKLFNEIKISLDSFDSNLNLNSQTIVHQNKEIYLATAGNEVILEFMIKNDNFRKFSHFDILKSMRIINNIKDFEEKFDVVAKEFRKITGIDRVMIYKFDEEYNGQVISESKKSSLNSYLGLYFPESDIPKQARALYLKKLLRTIPDVNYEAVDFQRLVSNPLDMSNSYLRAVSPMHIKYLQNMGVCATLTISIIVNNKLWGLIACHNYEPIYFSLTQLDILESFAQNFSDIISYEIQNNKTKFDSKISAILDQVNINVNNTFDLKQENNNVMNNLLDYSENLCNVFEANSFAIFNKSSFYSKDIKIIDKLDKLKTSFINIFKLVENSFYSTIELKNLDEFKDFEYPGILIFELNHGDNPYHLVWFKSEFVHEIVWGGDPKNKILVKDDGSLSPRNSFDAFVEKISNKSKLWNPYINDNIHKIIDTFNNLISYNFKLKSVRKLIDDHIMSLNINLNRDITNVSNAFLEILGFPKKEILSKKHDDLFTLNETNFKLICESLTSENNWEGELKFVKADSSIMYSYSILAIEYNSLGEKIGYFLIAYDITERKKLASIEEMNHILKIWQHASEETGDGFTQFDVQKQSFGISTTLKEALGYDLKDVLDISAWFELIHPDDYKTINENYKKLKNNEVLSSSKELRLRHKDGSYIWFIEKCFVLNNKDNSFNKIVAFYTNYNEIKNIQIQQQKKIKEQKEEFETIFRINQDGMAIIDLNGNILSFNDSLQSLFGFSEESLSKKSLYDLTLLRDQSMFAEVIEEVKYKGYKLNLRKSYNTNYDRVLIVEETLVLLPDCRRILVTIRDVSQRIILENNLKNAKIQADKANEAKSQFLANMSHEIRTPMNGIINLSKILSNENLDEKASQYADMIYKSSNSLLGILNDILDLSKIEAGKIELENKTENLSEIVKQLENIHSISAHNKNLLFQTDISDLLPEYILIDKLRLQQILSNLIGNAIKFTAKGMIHIILDKSEIENRSFLEIMIRDTGIGIDPESIDRIMNPFEQADVSTTRKYGGTGLGLSITNKIINLMGGKLEIYSKLGQGSTFTVLIPLVESSKEKFEDSTNQSIAINNLNSLEKITKKTILLAEDDVVNQIIIKELFINENFDLDIVDNGEDVLKAVKNKKYDLILMDNQMPLMGGIQTTKILRKNGFKEPIIAVSASVMEDEIKTFLDAGMNSHISKPIIKENLFEVIIKNLYHENNKIIQKEEKIDQINEKKKILVSEDDFIGQTIIRSILENLGCDVTIASDGSQAVNLLKRKNLI